MRKVTYKFNHLNPIKLKDYGFGLFLLDENDDTLYIKCEYGECYNVSTGEFLNYQLRLTDKQTEELEIIPIEY